MDRESRAIEDDQQPDRPAPLWRHLARLGPELGADWRPVEVAGPQVDAPPEPTAFGEVEIVEGDGDFSIRDVGPPAASSFRYFLDGIEQTRVCGYVGTVPLVHGYVAAVVRERRDRAFITWDLIEREILAFPHQLVDPTRFIDIGLPHDALIDSESQPADAHPIRLAESGRSAVKIQRAICERTLARRWAERDGAGNGWMLVDGGLAIEPALLRSGRAVGLVKSHRTQFLSQDHMTATLAMEQGQRSCLFKPVRPEVGEVYSWYLRLRPYRGHDIYWALARIEGRASEETVEAADEISRWLLAETAPVALPDTRWDVLLYPIRDCEQFLRARMPTLGFR